MTRQDSEPGRTPHALMGPPTDDQRALLKAIWSPFAKSHRWPTFDYVERTLYGSVPGLELDARTILASCPWVIYPGGLSAYGWVWSSTGRTDFYGSEDSVGLTVAGMNVLADGPQFSRAQFEVERFIWVLALLATLERSVAPEPFGVADVTVPERELAAQLPPEMRRELETLWVVMEHEYATRAFVHPSPDGKGRYVQPTVSVRAYAQVIDASDYLERLMAGLARSRPVPEPVLTSSLAVPEAIDYLNAVWRARANARLFEIRRADAAAKLAMTSETREEFESRLSALCEVLGHVIVPGVQGDSPLTALQTLLSRHLSDQSAPRALRAVDDLRAVFDLRAWAQHSGNRAHLRAQRAMQRLRVELPTVAWNDAWERLRISTVAALNALREEVEEMEPLLSATPRDPDGPGSDG